MDDSSLSNRRKKLRQVREAVSRKLSKLLPGSTKAFFRRLRTSKRAKFTATVTVCALGLVIFWPQQEKTAPRLLERKTKKSAPKFYFGMPADDMCIDEYRVQSGETFSGILSRHGVAPEKIEPLITACKKKFDLKAIRPGQLMAFIYNGDADRPGQIVYEPDIYHYYHIDFMDSVSVREVRRPVKYVHKSASGVIESNLWNAMKAAGASDELADYLADVLAWSVDFYHVFKGDEFKILYTEKQIDGKPVGVESIEAAYYKQLGVPTYVFKYKSDKYNNEYYDEKGRPARRAFLKAPVKYTRISSRYNPRRFHPVLKRRRPHLGTDFAAPRGTPVYATADGIVTKAAYTRGNGNYVKIRHNKIYSTQYLHFSRIAKGIRPGVKVKQGQVIGYVGSTGLATGPHVCYRFWKNGRQVDPLRQKLPAPPPMNKKDLPAYLTFMDSVKQILDAVPIRRQAPQPEDITAMAAKP